MEKTQAIDRKLVRDGKRVALYYEPPIMSPAVFGGKVTTILLPGTMAL